MPCGIGSRNQGVASASQGMPKIASKPPEARREHKTDSLREGTNTPTNSLILDF